MQQAHSTAQLFDVALCSAVLKCWEGPGDEASHIHSTIDPDNTLSTDFITLYWQCIVESSLCISPRIIVHYQEFEGVQVSDPPPDWAQCPPEVCAEPVVLPSANGADPGHMGVTLRYSGEGQPLWSRPPSKALEGFETSSWAKSKVLYIHTQGYTKRADSRPTCCTD
jgi:hypothetical protein